MTELKDELVAKQKKWAEFDTRFPENYINNK